MTLRTRLSRALVAFFEAPMEEAICACGRPFYRPIVPHPETDCDGCRDEHMDAWLTNYEARRAFDGQSARRIG